MAAVLFGTSVVAVRIAVRDVPPLSLALLRFGLGAIVLLGALAVFRRDLLRIDRRDLPYLATLGALFYTIFPVTFNAGLRYIEAARAAVIVATMPLWTVVLGRFIAHERLTMRQLVGVATSVAGVAIIMINRDTRAGSIVGDLLLLTTALCGAIYNVVAKRSVARYGGLTTTVYAMLLGTLTLLPLTLLVERVPSISSLSAQTIWLIVFLGVLGGAAGFSLWTSALKHLSPTELTVYINLNPVAATVLAATVLGERLSGAFAIGFVAVVAGVFVVNWRRD